MFDTVALSLTYLRPPDFDFLEQNGGKIKISSYTGEPYRVFMNGPIGSKEPRITLTKPQTGYWIVKAEVSIGEWLHGSNIYTPDENDIFNYYDLLSNFVYYKTGYKFDAENARVTRLDPFFDLQIGEENIARIIRSLIDVEIPRYDRKITNDTSVVYKNKGSKSYSTYDKMNEIRRKGATRQEIELARGILRIEVRHKCNRSVSNLSKSLKFPYHKANYLLTRAISEMVIQKAVKLLKLDAMLSEASNCLRSLADTYDKSKPLTLAGHLTFKEKFGINYHELPFINLSAETVKKYERECANAGSLSLE